MVVLYLLCLSTFVAAAPSLFSSQVAQKEETPPSCGQLSSLREPRIVGGREAYFGQLPWLVSIQIYNSHFCGGSIIGDRFILTASHCFLSSTTEKFIGNMTVVVGAQNLSDIDPLRTKIMKIKKVKQHEDYLSDGHYFNDIAILELTENIEWSPYVRPICLPDVDYVPENVTANISGWGQTWFTARADDDDEESDYRQYSDVLKTVNVTIFKNEECNAIYKDYKLEDTQICASVLLYSSFLKEANNLNGDAATGDSGGPLTVFLNERWTIAGITSASPRIPAPTIYTRVSSFIQWIQLNTL